MRTALASILFFWLASNYGIPFSAQEVYSQTPTRRFGERCRVIEPATIFSLSRHTMPGGILNNWRTAMMTIIRIVIAVLVASATPVFAQESEQGRQLRKDVDVLKGAVLKQNRRIEALEQELRGGTSVISPTVTNAMPTKNAALVRPPWHDGNSWGRVKNGMSESQVIAILGPPTSVEAVGGYKTLFYRGEVSGSGSVSGNTELSQDRVWAVNTPVF